MGKGKKGGPSIRPLPTAPATDPGWLRWLAGWLPESVVTDIREVITNPRVVLGLLIVGVVLGFWAAGHYYAERMANKDERIAGLQERIDGYEATVEGVKIQPETAGVDAESRYPPATPEQLRGTYVRGVSVRIADLLTPKSPASIQGKIFENCELRGPAVLYFASNVKMMGSNIVVEHGGLESVLWPLPINRDYIGWIAVADTSILNCRLVGVAFAGSPERLQQIRSGVTGAGR